MILLFIHFKLVKVFGLVCSVCCLCLLSAWVWWVSGTIYNWKAWHGWHRRGTQPNDVRVCVSGGHACHGTCVGIIEQHWVSVLSFYLVWGRVSLLFISAYARLANMSSQGFSCLSLQPHHRNTDITDTSHYMQLSVGLGYSHAERHLDPTNTVPTCLPLRLSNGIS